MQKVNVKVVQNSELARLKMNVTFLLNLDSTGARPMHKMIQTVNHLEDSMYPC